MSWIGAIVIGCVMFVVLVVGLFCVVDLVITWGDPKGGASGNLPPALTTPERVARSVPALVILAIMSGVLLLWWRAQRTA
ncbi:membrane protein [Rhodopirellula europaea 6C]|uniref:Membrane protein n=1 Tax=Rhodopirellula europaea 6C TaxID=1263867 RepID=M2ADY9_9BACT|nr:membrane protein [Rhodopirellula europaea 6C]